MYSEANHTEVADLIFRTGRKLPAVLLALALMLSTALAEDADWAVDAMLQPDAPLADAVVPEMEESELPTEEGPQAVSAPESAWAAPQEDPSVAAPATVAAPVMSLSEVTLGVKEKRTLTLSDGLDPRSVGAVFTSSDPKVVKVNASTGVLTGKKKGTATITMTAQGVESACAVTVKKAPKKIRLSAKKLTMGVGESAFLDVTLTKGTSSAITFTSSNSAVVTVDESGCLVATGVGKATVTAKTFNKKKAKCTVKVKAAPEYIALGSGALTLWQGRTVALDPTLSPNSGGAIYCSSSDPAIVSVNGMSIRAEAMGTATVTVTTYNGLSASVAVQVTRAPVYRALLVGENMFPGTGMSDLPAGKDVARMKKMLKSVKSPSGADWEISAYTDLTSLQIHDAIRSAFAGAVEGDVSLFFISTHGDDRRTFDDGYPEYTGYLQTYPDYGFSNWYDRNALTLVSLAQWLGEVRGQVVVLIDSCGSGAAIYNAKGTSDQAFSPQRFDSAVIDAFRDADRGVLAPGVDQGAFVVENKFYVLTSAAYLETGWSLKGKYSYFTKWLTDSIKTKGRMPADSDKNKLTTLHELYNCMKKKAAKKVFRYNGVSYRQHVQVYPANSAFELFYR